MHLFGNFLQDFFRNISQDVPKKLKSFANFPTGSFQNVMISAFRSFGMTTGIPEETQAGMGKKILACFLNDFTRNSYRDYFRNTSGHLNIFLNNSPGFLHGNL